MAEMISLARAQGMVAERAGYLDSEEPEVVPLTESLGRRLGRDYHAEGPWPSTDRSAMDGFAVAAGEPGCPAGSTFAVVGESLAGHPFSGDVADGQAIRIMTGAVVPSSVDAVVPVEKTSGFEGDTVTLNHDVRCGDNIRPMGSEVADGALLLSRGTRIRSAEVGALAVLGQESVPVQRRARVAILSTGDEVVPVGDDPAPHQVRDSNSHALAAQVLEAGGEPVMLGVGRDERDDLHRLLQAGLERADILLTIGGVSKGTHDLVHGLLSELGVEEVFHGIALKPGKPTYFGEAPASGSLVFGLPGNPASCYTVFDLLVRPLIEGRAASASGGLGEPLLAGASFRSNWRAQAIPARLEVSSDAGLVARLTEFGPSGNPFGMLPADGYAVLPEKVDKDLSRAPFWTYGGGWSAS